MPCRHCGRSVGIKSRGLCHTCYYHLDIRSQYRLIVKNTRGYSNQNIKPSPPESPTQAVPGSPEKVAILERRAEAQQELWHADDLDVLRIDD